MSIKQPSTYKAAVLAVIDPDAYTANTYYSAWVDMAKFKTAQLVVLAGTLGSSATLDGGIQQATSAAGAGAKAISGKTITQLTQAGSDSDKQAVVNVRDDELDKANAFRYIRGYITVGTATSDAGALLVGTDPVIGPASDNDGSKVDEVVL
jgi:hypothetical protein